MEYEQTDYEPTEEESTSRKEESTSRSSHWGNAYSSPESQPPKPDLKPLTEMQRHMESLKQEGQVNSQEEDLDELDVQEKKSHFDLPDPHEKNEQEQWGPYPDTPDSTPEDSELFAPKKIISFPKVSKDVEISEAVRELINKETPESLYANVNKTMPDQIPNYKPFTDDGVYKTANKTRLYTWDDTVFHSEQNKEHYDPTCKTQYGEFTDPWVEHIMRFGIGNTSPPPDEACKEILKQSLINKLKDLSLTP